MIAGVEQEVSSVVTALSSQDHTTDAVPLSERRDPLTMGLLWITMVTGFPSVLIGFQWFGAGLTLPQVIASAAGSCALLMLYCIPACMVGARSGLTYALLSRKVFGGWGSRFVSFNLFWISMSWYGLTAIFLAEGLRGIYHLNVSTTAMAVGMAILMTFNNFFGFSGVANFARYVAGPILVAWVGYTFIKAGIACPASVWSATPIVPAGQALTVVSSFIIGYSVWGNEADYWRYGKPTVRGVAIPLVVSLSIGQLLFPVTGWMMARMSGITNYAAATELMNKFAFGGISFVAAAVLFVTYLAINDSMLYGAINAWQNIRATARRKVVLCVAMIGSGSAALLSMTPKSFEAIASLSSVVLPCATIIIVMEHVISRSGKSNDIEDGQSVVPAFDQLPAFRFPAFFALIAGCLIGLLTSGVVPGTETWHFGIPALQSWLTCIICYPLLLWIERRWTEPAVSSNTSGDPRE